jgi:hypothetical protein
MACGCEFYIGWVFSFSVWNGGGGRLGDGFSGWVPVRVGFLGWLGE